MVRFGQHTGEADGEPPVHGDAGIATITLRDLSGTSRLRRPRLLDQHLLLLCTVGHGTQEVDFQVHPCRPGTLIWARPGQVVRSGGQPGLDAIIVTWRPEVLTGLGSADPSTIRHGTGYWQLAGEDEDAVINEVSQLVVDCQRHRAGEPAADLLRHQLAVLLLRLALLPTDGARTGSADRPPARTGDRAGAGAGRPAAGRLLTLDRYPGGATAPGRPRNDGPPVRDSGNGAVSGGMAGTYQRLRHELERSHRDTRRVEDYAERLDCSVRTLTRACLAVTGRSAKQVIDDRVALQAMRLLAATDTPIADIGRWLGFPEPTNFGRFFQREVGQSPGAFRATLGGGRSDPAGRPAAEPRPPRLPGQRHSG
ncbi:AraC family transcriptional regulator [Solwaraspora sp. WMMD1047]|uniref:helix-turn-helix transcriptional regulator n=1 Tax=Solwaraspora sp. WMMD1047 TaxID=3016102 RepID=UPI002417B8E1|nr:AraC family transcriptional regulator [Solwaraspora sp. WMMD1047]MDG4831613.1 AraC family transcriptional regulator [Solwaraspora sp. WMMD1047]